MIYQTHVPRYPLSEFVDWFWFYEGLLPDHDKERLLPHGALELVIDLQPEPKRLFDREDHSRFRCYRRAWLSGAHSEFIVIQATVNSSMMGIHFKPGGAYPFVRLPVHELKDSVVELDALWGPTAITLRDELLEQRGPAAKFQTLERFLLKQARECFTLPSAIAFALHQLNQSTEARSVGTIAEQVGVSHKHFIDEFSKWVGLSPKMFHRIRRFQHVLRLIEGRQGVEWADVASACGYYDQPHFIRDFQAFSGLNPSAYLTERGEYFNFVPIR